MRTILIDVGNTALKWCEIGREDEPHTVVHRNDSNFRKPLYEAWLAAQPDRVVGCTVAAPDIAFSVTKFFNDHDIRWQWVRPQAVFESARYSLTNAYRNAAQLGADRWHAAIGAVDFMHEAAPGTSILVVQMGTAATVDAVRCCGEGRYEFLGGRIAPGPTLMKQSLESGIPSLSVSLGEWAAFPQSTADAIASGIIDAQAGLVALSHAELKRFGAPVQILLAGGASQFLEARLRSIDSHLIIRHNLVLRGLAARASRQDELGGRQ